MRPREADALAASFDDAPADQVTTLFGTLREGLGLAGAASLADDLAKGKRPEYAVAIMLSEHSPLIARGIILGSRLKRENRELELPAGDKRDASATVVGNAFAVGAGVVPRAAFVAAGDALYAARRVPGGDLSFDAETYQQALKDAMGGPVEFNGRVVIPPQPMDEDDFRDMVRGLTDEDLEDFGTGSPVFGDGTAFTAERFQARLLGLRAGVAQLVTSGPGRYMIFIPSLGFIQNDGLVNGRALPYEIDLNGLR